MDGRFEVHLMVQLLLLYYYVQLVQKDSVELYQSDAICSLV